MLDETITIKMSGQEALDLCVVIAAKQADLLHKKIETGILEWHEIRIAASLAAVHSGIDREIMKMDCIGWTPAEDVPSLKLVRDGKQD